MMTETQITEQLQEIFRDVFDREALTISQDTTADDVEGCDSIAHVSLVVEIQREFGVTLVLQEIQAMKTVGDMIALIARKLQN